MLAVAEKRILPALPQMVARYAHVHADAEEDFNAVVDAASEDFFTDWNNERFATVAQPIARTTAEFQREQLRRQLEAGLGIDLYRGEPWLQGAIELFTKENVALIKSVPTFFFSELEKSLSQGIADGERPEELARRIEERYGVAESKAALIARDQVGKFYGDLNERRQTDLGITSYVWRGSLDERERPEHLEREGKTFEWKEPPEDGNPGEPVCCRCFAEPDLEAILSAL